MTDKIFEIVEKIGLSFTKQEVIDLVEKDICTNERSVIDYIILKNVSDALKDMKNKEEYLKRNVPTNIYYDILKAFNACTI